MVPMFTGKPGEPVNSLAFSPDDRYLAYTAGTQVRVRLLETGEELVLPDTEGDDLTVVVFSKVGGWLVAAGMEGVIWLWSTANLEGNAHLLIGHNGAIRSLAFAPDGKNLVSAGDDGGVRLWSLAELAAPPRLLFEDEGAIWPVVFSPDGQWLAGADSVNNVRLWTTDDWAAAPLAPRDQLSSCRCCLSQDRRAHQQNPQHS